MSTTLIFRPLRACSPRESALLPLAAALAFLAGCGGGGSSSGGTVLGLSVANQMSVITVDGGGATGPVTSGASADTSGFAADANYFLDERHSHVYDSSLETVSTVNMILCDMAQTAYAQMVNFGPYLALVDEARCEAGGDSSSSGSSTGQSSGANSGAPSLWTIDSTRASNSSPETVQIWLPSNGPGDMPVTINVKLTITESSSLTNPFGVFNLDFAGIPQGGSLSSPAMFGNLHSLDVASGFMGFSFFQQQGNPSVAQQPGQHAEIVQSNVNMFADQTQGVAYIRRQYRENFGQGDSGLQIEEYKIAFDLTNVLRQKDSDAAVCLSRTTYNSRTWRYNLYDATNGARVELNSGFGFRTQAGDFGWMGYYGMWVQPGVTVANGDTVTRDTFGQATPQAYTVLTAPGKLIRNTKQTLALSAIVGMNFNWYHDSDPMDGLPGQQFRVQYDGTNWIEVASWDDSSHTWIDLGSPVVIDTAVEGFLGMYCESLGGPSTYVDGDSTITYYQREFVNGADAAFSGGTQIDIYGYFNCLRGGITTSEANIGDIFLPPSQDVSLPYHYVFSQADLTLYYDVNGDGSSLVPAGLASGETITSGPNMWGMQSGSMLTDYSGLTSPFEAWNQPVFYTYETGPNSWNQYAALIDSNGVCVTFDPPIQFTYMHETLNDANNDATYDGMHYQLNYGGPGNLFGIPSAQVDTDGDGNPDRFYPLFTIADGILMGPTGTEYVVRSMEQELTLALDPGNCGALDVGTVGDLPLPTAADYTAPDIGAPPVVTDPPAVIEGVVQTGG